MAESNTRVLLAAQAKCLHTPEEEVAMMTRDRDILLL